MTPVKPSSADMAKARDMRQRIRYAASVNDPSRETSDAIMDACIAQALAERTEECAARAESLADEIERLAPGDDEIGPKAAVIALRGYAGYIRSRFQKDTSK